MSITTVKIKGWQCTNQPQCHYIQNTDPNNPYQQSAEMFPDVPFGKCPSCYGKIGEFDLVPVSEESTTTVNVADDTTLEAEQVPERDQDGNQLMEQVGEHYELRVNQSTGAITSELVPDYAPKMRSLTDQELADLKLQRDQNLDELEQVAV